MTQTGADPSGGTGPAEPGGHRYRFGLRTRSTAAFAAGAALLSCALAITTYVVAQHYLLDQRQTSATNQTFTNARLVKEDLASAHPDIADVLTSLKPAAGTRALVYRDGKWFSTSVALGHGGLPPALVHLVESGHVARQRVIDSGQPEVIVGVPLRSIGADYFEVHSLSELSSTLHLLWTVLLTAAILTTLGGIVLGRWSSRHVVKPLTEVAGVAGAVTAGALERRLPADDPDLDPLVESFNEMVDALQRRIERDTRFVSDVSHELRSPLTTVQASVDLLEAFRTTLPPEGQQALDFLGIEVERFSGMVQDLLELSRLDAGGADVDLEEVDVEEFVTNTVNACTVPAIPVVVEPAARGATVRCDRRRMQRVIVNLLDNTTVHAGGAVVVRIGRQADLVHVDVDDRGPGVPDEDRARIFERFYRGAAAGRRSDNSGAGLGLALAAEHAHAQGARLTLGDRPGGGARFRIELRAVVPAPREPVS